MSQRHWTRREVVGSGMGALGAAMAGSARGAQEAATQPAETRGKQRLNLEALQRWESLGYGMFIHFGMSTFVGQELPDGKAPGSAYAPDQLDVDQWVSVARDAGMKYIVLTAKHVAGHCLWPSKHTDYTVANSGNKTDVFAKFTESCRKRGVLPGFYYCSWDNHHRFGSRTPSDEKVLWDFGASNLAMWAAKTAADPATPLPAYTTSMYQNFQTAQIEELLTQYGPIMEVWVDIPGVLGRGYREFLYRRIAALQPETVVMMNSGISTGETYDVDYAWPSDLIAIERQLPPEASHQKWRTIERAEYYMPGEVCDPIGKDWFWVQGDSPRPIEALAKQWTDCRARGVNLLLDVPPDKHGRIPQEHVEALMGLRKQIKL